MPVREAAPGDVAVVHRLIGALADYEDLADQFVASVDDLARHLFGAGAVARALVAELDGEIVGFALWFPTFSTFLGRPGIWLEDLFVLPEHRGRGLGRELLEALRARTDGRLEWAVLDWNAPAIGFYGTLGARPLDGWTTYRWGPPEG